MIIVGAKGFAKQLVEIFSQKEEMDSVYFFDDISDASEFLYDRPVLKAVDEVKKVFKNEDAGFCLGLGGPLLRYQMSCKFKEMGGQLKSVISPYAFVAAKALLKSGVCVLTGTVIENDVVLDEGVLINTHASVHHDSFIGKYSEIAPGARILGGCIVGEFAFIGANAVILPKIRVGKNAVIGAGAIVTKNVEACSVVMGNPARHIRFTNES